MKSYLCISEISNNNWNYVKNITLLGTCTLNILNDVSKKRAILNYSDS